MCWMTYGGRIMKLTNTKLKNNREYYFLYTGIFILMALAIYGGVFLLKGKTFIRNHDGFVQHYRVLMYYGEWLRSIVRTLLTEHRLVLPEWNFSIGYGANVLTTLHYYAIGDPLTLLSAFVPAKYTLYLYGFLVILRGYLAGLFFSCYCLYMKQENRLGILAGAFTYVFCHYVLRKGLWHPFFMNPMLYMPLILLGVEKIFRKERPYLFILSVFISAFSNFYFFYMLVLVTVLYVLIRCCGISSAMEKGKRLKYVFLMIAKIGWYSVIGVMLSAVLFLPVVRAFFNDYRSSVSSQIPLWYTDKYYDHLWPAFSGAVPITEGQMFLGYGAQGVMAVLFLFIGKNRKQHSLQLKIFFILGTLMLIFPMASYALNGFSYAAARWIWAYSFLAAFLVVEMWDDFFDTGNIDFLIVAIIALLYIIFNHEFPKMRYAAFTLLAVLGLLAVSKIVEPLSRAHFWQTGMLMLVLFGIVANAHVMLKWKPDPQIKNYLTKEEVDQKMVQDPDAAVLELTSNEDFSRTFGDGIYVNTALNTGAHNVQFYWSLSNKNISQFLISLGVREERFYKYSGQDDRIGLAALAGCKYFVCKKEEPENVPFGYRLVKETEKYLIYVNDFALPIAYTYDSCITEKEFDQIDILHKEEAMLQSVVLEKEADTVPSGQELTLSGQEIGYQVVPGNEYVTAGEKSFTTTEKDTQVALALDKVKASGNVYVYVSGLNYEGTTSASDVAISMVASDGIRREKSINYYTEDDIRPSGQSDYIVNLGYSEELPDEVTIGFEKKGTYNFDNIVIWSQPVETFEKSVEARKKDVWENEKIGTDTVSGTINLKDDKILVLSIPFDGGWTAYVDGKEQELLRANIMYCGLELPAGDHTIELVYHTPGLKLGFFITLAGMALFVLIIIYFERRRTACGLSGEK